MTATHFELSRLPVSSWKNGAGLTREIVRSPRDSTMETFAWRASIAEVSESGAFSTFPGVDRAIVLLSGRGASLRSEDGVIDHRLDETLVPFSFPGEASIAAALVGGSSIDFNIMTRRETTRAELHMIRSPEVLARSSSGLVLSTRGEWTAAIGTESYRITADCGVWWDGDDVGCRLVPLSANPALIAVRVWQVSPGGVSA